MFIAALVPAVILIYLTWAAYNGQTSAWPALTGNFSANPLEDITHGTGDWALRFLCITLAITPLRRLTGWNGAIRFRRMLGLFAFFYAMLHFLTYALLDRFASLDFAGGMLSWAAVRALAAWIVGRHLQAAVHHDRVRRLRGPGAAGPHLDRRDDSPPRRAPLADRCTG